MRVIPLGTMGWIPSSDRAGICVAVKKGDSLLIMDMGTGLKRLIEHPASELLDHCNEVYILLSHFHLDHLIGLTYVPGLFQEHNVHLYGPGQLFGMPTKDVLSRLLTAPFFSLNLEDITSLTAIRELRHGEQEVGPFAVNTRIQKHPGSSLGFVIDGQLAFVTDTICDPETSKFAANCDLLIHECWYLEENVRQDHAHLPGIVKIARNAGASKLGLIHLNPLVDVESYQREVGSFAQGEVSVMLLNDLQEICL